MNLDQIYSDAFIDELEKISKRKITGKDFLEAIKKYPSKIKRNALLTALGMGATAIGVPIIMAMKKRNKS